jgi:tetratricopeptide (TPR) repeat protein
MDDITELLERYFLNDANVYFDVDEIIELIYYFIEQNDTDNANNLIEMGYQLHPDDVDFKISMCFIMAESGDFQSSLKACEELGIGDDLDLDLLRSECYAALDRYDDISKLTNQLRAEDVSYFEDFVVNTAGILNDYSKYQNAASAYILKGLQLYPDNFLLRIEMCISYELRGDTKNAINLCNELLKENVFSPDIWLILGRLHASCLNLHKAIDSLDYGRACLPAGETGMEYELKRLKAYCLMEGGNYEAALEYYDELVGFKEFNKVEIFPNAANCYLNTRMYEAAYALYSDLRGLEAQIDDLPVYYAGYIYCCHYTNHLDEAMEILKNAIVMYPYLGIDNILQTKTNKQPDNFFKDFEGFEDFDDDVEDDNSMARSDYLAESYLSQLFNSN